MTSTKLAATGLMVNEIILDLLGKVLALSDYRGIICEMYPFDVELLLDLISYVCALLFPLFVYFTLCRYSAMGVSQIPVFKMETIKSEG